MNKKILLTLIIAIMSRSVWADCKPKETTIAPVISIDISSKLHALSRSLQEERTTLFSGNYTCTPPILLTVNAIGVVNTFKEGTATIGFNGGKQFVQISVNNLNNPGIENISAGTYQASNLNTLFSMNFSLVAVKPSTNYIEIPGNTFAINAVIVATDASGLGLLGAIVTLLFNLVTKLLTFLLTLTWPIDKNDIFIQPVTIIYNPLITTCDFANKDLYVDLPMITMKDLKTATRPGYTPFSLNFKCNDLINGTNSSRDISVFLASSNLLETNKTVLKNTNDRGAKNVGFRVVKADNLNNPIIFSDSITAKNGATDIFNVPKNASLDSSFSVNMGVYYYPYVINNTTGGAVSSSARLVFSYD